MYGPRDYVLLLAGAQLFHAASHLVLRGVVALPIALKRPRMLLTPRLNRRLAVVNAAIAAALLWWVGRM
jgi:hypothetical protein